MSLESKLALLSIIILASASPHKHTASSAHSPEPSEAFLAPLTSNRGGTRFHVPVTVGGNTFPLLLDTGSADTWLLSSDYQCLSPLGQPRPQSSCGFTGPTYSAGSEFEPIENKYVGIAYGGGLADGALGSTSATLAGLTASEQLIGVVARTTLDGSEFGSGLLGLAYKGLTAAHNGSVGDVDPSTYPFNRTLYTPLFNTLVEEHGIEPYFSVALERDDRPQKGGWLALGCLPPVSHEDTWSHKDVLIPPLPLNLTDGRSERTWWLIEVDGVQSGGKEILFDKTIAVTDTGNYLNFLPPKTAAAVAEAFDPPAVLNTTSERYQVACDANPPKFGITLDGQTFWQDEEDMILPGYDGTGIGDVCISTVQPLLGIEVDDLKGSILGDPFFKNVVAVHDFGKNEMRFAAKKTPKTDGVRKG